VACFDRDENDKQEEGQMEDFEFQIGDIVVARTAIQESLMHARGGEISYPRYGMVVGRFQDECPGGTQKHYAVSVDAQQRRYHEIELLKITDPPADLTELFLLHDEIRAKRARP
jgi:hypothetical protein